MKRLLIRGRKLINGLFYFFQEGYESFAEMKHLAIQGNFYATRGERPARMPPSDLYYQLMISR
jgi:hypothetical protein